MDLEQIVFEPIIKDKGSTDTLPWVEKYRPTKLDDVLSHQKIISMLKIYIQKESLPHLLFYGPPGTGKTSTIVSCAKQMYGDAYRFMVLEINASVDRGIEAVRTQIQKFVMASTTHMGDIGKRAYKLVILDETDAMTHDAQAILRNIVENYTSNARFCLICNYIKKIIPALQSRCTIFRFSPLSRESIDEKLRTVAKIEGVNVTDDGCRAIIDRANGDMRKVMNILQAVSMAYEEVNEHNLNQCLGYPQRDQIHRLIENLRHNTFDGCFEILNTYKTDLGISLDDVLHELEKHLRLLLMGELTESPFADNSLEQNARILSRMRRMEESQSNNSTDKIQIAGLIGIFKL